MAAPTFVSYGDSGAFATAVATGTVRTISSVAVLTGDILVVFGLIESGGGAFSTPAGGSLTYTQQQKPNADNDALHSQAYLWTATASAGATFNITSTMTGGTYNCGIGCYVFRAAALGTPVTAGNEASGTAPSLAITTVGANSAVVYAGEDWNGVSGASRTWRTINSITPTSGNGAEKLYALNSGSGATFYSAYWSDVGAAGSQTTGMTAPTGQQQNAVVIEIQGAAAAASVPQPVIISQAINRASRW